MQKPNRPEAKNFDYLLDSTRNVLDELVETASFLSKYSLVGGSALALYLCHRKSEDLDFFTYAEGFSRQEIVAYISRFDRYEILNENIDQLDILLNGVKVTFFDARWEFLRPEKTTQLNIASLESIVAMKVNVLFVRAKYRDYYDLYCLSKMMELTEMFSYAKPVVNGLTQKLFGIALLYIDDIDDDKIDHLEPLENLDKKEIRSYFEKRLQALVAKT